MRESTRMPSMLVLSVLSVLACALASCSPARETGVHKFHQLMVQALRSG